MKISSLLREAPKGPALSLDNDLMQRAMLRFPGYDSQQALSLYIADKAVQQQKTDAAQNNLINTQQNAIKSIGQELQDYEAQAQETDREVERLKQLSGTLTTGSADRQQKAKVSADELEKLQKDLEDLKTKPGMDPEKYKEIEQQISALANSNGAEDADVKKLQNLVNNIQNKATVNYDAVAAQLEKTKQDLDSKEERFANYVDDTNTYKKTSSKEIQDLARTSAEEIQKYSKIVDAAKEKIDNFDKFMNTERDNILNLRGEIQQMADEIATNIRFVKPSIRPNAAAVAQGAIDNAQATSQGATQQFKPPELDPELFGDEEKDKSITKNRSESKVFEEANMAVRPALDYSHDPDKAEWMAKYLPMMVRSFKKKYAIELSKKHPTYSDHQIAYTIEDNIDFLFKHEENPISKQTMDAFYNWVKTDLFGQPPESSTLHLKQNDLFSESLDKTYSRMLDNLIGLPYIKG
jgi:chromosome segregation ATPase